MDAVTFALSKQYVNQTANALGAVKGAPCVIQNIVDTGTANEVTFKWTGTDGTEQTRTMTTKHGVSVVNVEVDDDNNLTCTLSDGAVIDCGSINVETDVDKIDYTTNKDTSVTNVKDALDALFEDGGGVLEEEITPNVIMGSVKANYPVGTYLEEIIRDMLTENIPPTISLVLNPSTLLYDIVNDSVSSLTINATVTKKTNNIAKIEYYVGDTLVHTNTSATGGSYPYIYNTVIDETTTIKVVVTDTEGLSSTATKTIEFVGNSYYGIVDANTGEPTEAIIKTLNKNLKNTKKFVYSGITTDWGKVCYAYPSNLGGALTSIKDEVNSFNYTNSFAKTTLTIDGIEYFVYTQIDASAASNVEITFA